MLYIYFSTIAEVDIKNTPQNVPLHISITKLQGSNKFSQRIRYKLRNENFNFHVINHKYTQKGVRRRRRRNDGILRLAVTDNINVLRARLLQEIARRQKLARKNMQNRLDSVG